MSGRLPAVVLLAAAIVCTGACAMWTTRGLQSGAEDRQGDRLAGRSVERLVKTDGDQVVFSRSKPGRVRAGRVEGVARFMVREKVEVRGPFAQIRKRSDGTISEVTDAAGRTHYVRSVLDEKPDALVVEEVRRETGPVSVPLAEVRSITFRKVNVPLTILAAAGAAAVWFVIQTWWNLTHY
jgi:hypothetical protein